MEGDDSAAQACGTGVLVLERAAGTSGRVALEQANEAIRVALAQLVDSAVARTGLVLPTDDPNRERSPR